MRDEIYSPRYFDNFTDDTISEWENITRKFIEITNQKLFKSKSRKRFKKYCIKEQVNLGYFLEEYIKSNSSILNNDNKIDLICILANFKYYNDDGKSEKLFDNFPIFLKNLAIKLLRKEILSTNSKKWRNNIDKQNRLKMLKDELIFFTDKKIIITKSLRNDLNTIKLQTKKEQNRKSPNESAKLFNIGEKRKGNDGNMWIIIVTKTNIKRWKKI